MPNTYATTRSAMPFDLQSRPRAFRVPLRLSERRLLLLFGDMVALLLALTVGLVTWRLLRPSFVTFGPELIAYRSWLVAFPTVWLILLAVVGGYDLRAAANVFRTIRRVATVAGFFLLGYLIFFFVSANQPNTYYSFPGLGDFQALRILPILFTVSAFALTGFWRWLYATQLTKGQFQRRLLVVGAGVAGRTFLETCADEGLLNAHQIVGIIDDDARKQSTVIAELPVLGTHERLVDIAMLQRVDEIVLAISQDLNGGMFEAIMACFERGIQITPMPVMYENLTGRVPVEFVGKHWYVSLPVGAMPPGHLYVGLMRILDVLAALLGLLFTVLLLPLIWLSNRIWSPGPLLYWQERTGRSGKPYMMPKFRSMVPDAEKASGAVWASERDPRITPFGHFLRKSRIDELPQFWNVLKGEMSLIGPRPERPEFVEQLAETIPFYRSRHAVKPGLTGWAQVRYRYGASVEDALIKLQYDLYFIKHQSLWLSFIIIYKTVLVIVGLKGR